MSTLAELLDGLVVAGDGFSVAVDSDWLQGRTLYGGLSAALSVAAAGRAFEGLPPLRSAQIAFVGPATGGIWIAPSVLRKGKSTLFAGVDLFGDAGLATRAMLCFGAARNSVLGMSDVAMPGVPAPEDCAGFFKDGPRPGFVQHFEIRSAGESLVWVRHRNDTGVDPAVSLITLADVPPPAGMALLTGPAPVSTMTWTVDFLEAHTTPDDGWRLLRSRAETAAGGYSTQLMNVWSRHGIPLAAGRQSVAVFA